MGVGWANQSSCRRGALVLAASCALGLAAGPGAVASGGRVLLTTNKVARWAPLVNVTFVHTRPSGSSPSVHTLYKSFHNFSGTHSVTVTRVLLLAELQAASGQTWYQVRYPSPTDHGVGWISSSHVGAPHTVFTHLYVDRESHRAKLQRAGQTVLRFPVGVGARRTPTPAGQFIVEAKVRIRSDPVYGPLVFKTSDASRTETDWPGGLFMVLLQGTDEPNLIPGDPSHGEIRMYNSTIQRLARLMPVGTPLTIR